jgi:hypothetical protein
MVAFPPFQKLSLREGYHAASLHNPWLPQCFAKRLKPAMALSKLKTLKKAASSVQNLAKAKAQVVKF